MTAEDGAEQTVLHPAYVELLELRILRCRATALGIIGTTEETADIGVEVGITRQREAQTSGHLFAEHIPRGGHIATPHVGAVMLLACEG